MRILHAADLHLSCKSDQDYGLGVLQEIVKVALDESVDALLFCGDVFDTFESLEQLRGAWRETIAPLDGKVSTFIIPGNHEDLGRVASQDLMTYDLGVARLLAGKPFSFLEVTTKTGPLELLAIPHQSEAFDFRLWQVPEKKAAVRVAMAHGLVQGMSYAGPDVEEGGASLDPDMFGRFQVDYAALGHIHGRREEQRGSTLIAYSGSSRVWRSGEAGERCVNLVEIGESGTKVVGIPLKSAGLYRCLELPLNFDGSLPEINKDLWRSQDFVEIKLSGLVDDETVVKAACDRFEQLVRSSVRRLIIRRDDLIVLSGISNQPLAQRFLDLWQQSYPAEDSAAPLLLQRQRQVWYKARDLALREMKNLLEGA